MVILNRTHHYYYMEIITIGPAFRHIQLIDIIVVIVKPFKIVSHLLGKIEVQFMVLAYMAVIKEYKTLMVIINLVIIKA